MMIAVVTKPGSKMTMVDKHTLSDAMLVIAGDVQITDLLVVAQDEAMNNTVHKTQYHRGPDGMERVKETHFSLGTPADRIIG